MKEIECGFVQRNIVFHSGEFFQCIYLIRGRMIKGIHLKLYGICSIFDLTESIIKLRDQLSVGHYGGIDNTVSGNIIGDAVADKGQRDQRYHGCDQKRKQEFIAKRGKPGWDTFVEFHNIYAPLCQKQINETKFNCGKNPLQIQII